MEQELKEWILEEKKRLWKQYQEGTITEESLKIDCTLLDEIFTNQTLN